METLRIGSRGEDVKILQNLLQNHGYSLFIDGIFGNRTENIVLNFQQKNNLDIDGIVGNITWSYLKNNNEKSEIFINKTKYVLPEKNYSRKLFTKTCCVLHHTNGWVVKKGTKDEPCMNHVNWWGSRNDINYPLGTAYSIDYKGNIYEHFNPDYWAYHLGVGKKRNYLDKQSIGIEITNEGFLDKKSNNKFVWYSGNIELPYNRSQDKPIYVKEKWRGYNWFAPYSNEQIKSTIWLIKFLCKKYNIKMNFISDCNYHSNILNGKYEGIYSHSNIRNYPSRYPKWDLSIVFPFEHVKKELMKK